MCLQKTSLTVMLSRKCTERQATDLLVPKPIPSMLHNLYAQLCSYFTCDTNVTQQEIVTNPGIHSKELHFSYIVHISQAYARAAITQLSHMLYAVYEVCRTCSDR